MQIFWEILEKTSPLYLMIFAGFLGGRYLKIEDKTVTQLLIYFFVPIVFLDSVLKANLKDFWFLPVLILVLCTSISILVLWISSFFYKDKHKNLLAFATGYGNYGFFGFPLIISLLGEEAGVVAVFSAIGFQVFQDVIGFYIFAGGNSNPLESIKKLLKIPSVYTTLIGLSLNIINILIKANFYQTVIESQVYNSTIAQFRGGFVILGMLIIGLQISKIDLSKFNLDFKLISLTFLFKFLVWPLAVILLFLISQNFGQFLTKEVAQIFLLFALTPLAAFTGIYAIMLKIYPEKASFLVLLSSIFAIFYIPLGYSFFLGIIDFIVLSG